MGVSSTTNRTVTTGTGLSGQTFSFGYYTFQASDIAVYKYDTIGGTATKWALGTDYTVTSGAQNAQGIYLSGLTITPVSYVALTTDIIVMVREPQAVQDYALGQNNNINSAALTQQFDYLTLLVQQLQDQVSRCIQIPDGLGVTFNPILPATIALASSAGAVPSINSEANGMSLVPTIPGNIQTATIGFAALQTAATVNHYAAFVLPAGAVLTFLAIKHATSMQGGIISACTASVGIASNYTKFFNAFDMYQAPGPTVLDSELLGDIESMAANTQIYLTATSTGANLSALTQGSVTVYYAYQFLTGTL